MRWTIVLFVTAGLILLLGVIKTLRDACQKKPGRNPTRDLIITVVLAFLAGIYPILQLLQPSEIEESLKPTPEIAEGQQRMEQKIDQLRREIGEPMRYQDGIPQSPNLNLRTLFEEGEKHLDNYEYGKAIKAFRAALALQNLKPSEAAALLIHIGIVQYKQSKWDEAMGSCKDALGSAKEAEDEDGQATALGNLGLVYKAKGQWDKAIEFYEKSLKINEKLSDEHGMAKIFHNLALAYGDKGERDKEIEFYNKSLKIKGKLGDEHGMAQTYGNLGNVYQLKGEWDKAIEFHNKSLKIKEKIGDEHGMAQTKANIGILYKAQGKKDEARKLLKESLRTLERIGDRPNAEIVRRHLSAIGRSAYGGEDL